MNEYVLVYARRVGIKSDDTLIVLKNRPAWQAGRFNLPGGKIEKDETPIQAAVRELKEETGLDPIAESTIMGHITGQWGKVWCVKVPVFDTDLYPDPNETEVVAWVDWLELRDCEFLIPNLRVIIPMMQAGVLDWVVRDEGVSAGQDTHTIEVTVRGMK